MVVLVEVGEEIVPLQVGVFRRQHLAARWIDRRQAHALQHRDPLALARGEDVDDLRCRTLSNGSRSRIVVLIDEGSYAIPHAYGLYEYDDPHIVLATHRHQSTSTCQARWIEPPQIEFFLVGSYSDRT